jgi:hypothetical protein
MNINTKAEEFSKMIEFVDEERAKERNTRANIYLVKKEHETNEELKELIRSAHGESLPDDYIYEFISDALDLIAECETEEEVEERICEIEADVYTSNLTAWLNSTNSRVYYLTEALTEFEAKDGFNALMIAQSLEKQEVARSVLNSLRELVEE